MSNATNGTSGYLVPSAKYSELFDRLPFTLDHRLAGHPLFELPRLARMAEDILHRGDPRNFSHFEGKGLSAGTRLPARETRARVSRAIEQLANSGSWIKLTSAQDIDPECATLLDDILREVETLTGERMRHLVTWKAATIFIASPATFTPYHIDHNHNFLLQIRGTKQVNVFDPADRAVLSEDEIEQFYVGDDSAAKYKPEIQTRAFVHELAPGQGVYQPSLSPHWVRNGDEPSIALSVGFNLRTHDTRGRVYQVNHYLRRLGLRPAPLGQSPVKDRAKVLAVGLVSKRHPETYRETIYSGIERVRAVTDLTRRAVRRARAFASR
jgi:hypothetical protein